MTISIVISIVTGGYVRSIDTLISVYNWWKIDNVISSICNTVVENMLGDYHLRKQSPNRGTALTTQSITHYS